MCIYIRIKSNIHNRPWDSDSAVFSCSLDAIVELELWTHLKVQYYLDLHLSARCFTIFALCMPKHALRLRLVKNYPSIPQFLFVYARCMGAVVRITHVNPRAVVFYWLCCIANTYACGVQTRGYLASPVGSATTNRPHCIM